MCPTCGQTLTSGGLRQATGTFSRRRTPGVTEGAPYRPQDLVANRYLVKDVAGSGPLGFVFRAHDKEIDVEVALKVIHANLVQSAEERRQFARHLRLARKLSHPNLVRVYEEGEDGERPYFTAQFLDGLSLRKIIDLRLQKGQFFAPHEIEPILTQVCAALDGAHKVGPHSNLKPENVLVLPDLLKVTDFGLGLALPRLPFVQALKARRADRYLAPEFVEGGEVDGRADIYAVGVILGEMLSGLTPDGSIPELQRRNPQVSLALEGLYRKAVNANPNVRFKTAVEMAQELSSELKRATPPPAPRLKGAAPSGVVPPRPRTTTGMLHLQPRRDKPPPPVSEPPPPPLPRSGAEGTPQPGGPDLPRALRDSVGANGSGHAAREEKKDREETEVIDSGMFIAQLDAEDNAETRAMVEVVASPPEPLPEPPPAGKSRAWPLVLLLVLVGAGVGAGGGYVVIQRQKAAAQLVTPPPSRAQLLPTPEVQPPPTPDVPTTPAPDGQREQAALQDALEAAQLAQEREARERAERERRAAAARVKPSTDTSVQADAERLAAEKAAAQRAAAEKAAADRAAAAEKAAADRAAAAEKAAADRAAAAEKAAADKAAAAEKAAADKAAAEKKLAAAGAAVAPVAKGAGCPDGMRAVPAGSFKMGTAASDPMRSFDEKSLSTVEVGAFCVDAWEYPNRRGVTPTTNVGIADARRLCEAQGKRLCSEAEWERACKGPGGARWPYGNTFDGNACNTEDDAGDPRAIAATGRFARCRSGFGAMDMSGNVAEWTEEKIIKGGSFSSPDYAVRCSARTNGASITRTAEVGFRCCAEPR